jgi:hypothetical protein
VVNFFSQWWPWLLVTAVPGILNILVAIDELFKKCRRLPFFQPQLSPGFWLWSFLQFSIPAGLFWLLFSLNARPDINLDLWGKTLAFGMGFVVVLNSRTDIAALPTVDIKKIYDSLIFFAMKKIADRQTGKTTAFLSDVENDLKNSASTFQDGFDYLALYFDLDISLTVDEKKEYQKRVQEARTMSDFTEQIKAILNLLEVRRKDLPEALQRFGVSKALIRRYFPKAKVDSLGSAVR